MTFVKAERRKTKLRLCLMGISGSGKTKSSLKLAEGIGGKIALIDTERGSSALYSDEFNFDICKIESPFTPQKYIQAVKAAEKDGYDVLIIDSLSHAWAGEGGVLDMHTAKTNSSRSQNSYVAWKDITPLQNQLVETILQSRMHVIVTMRCKTHYDLVDEGGRKKPIKVGLSPVQRADMEYEFDCVFDLSQSHYASSSKDRTNLFVNRDFIITKETGEEILEWLNSGSENPEISIATESQLVRFKILLDDKLFPEEVQKKWLDRMNISSFEDANSEKMEKLIDYMKNKIASSRSIENTPEIIQPEEVQKYVNRVISEGG
jgi:hypothetical protein